MSFYFFWFGGGGGTFGPLSFTPITIISDVSVFGGVGGGGGKLGNASIFLTVFWTLSDTGRLIVPHQIFELSFLAGSMVIIFSCQYIVFFNLSFRSTLLEFCSYSIRMF